MAPPRSSGAAPARRSKRAPPLAPAWQTWIAENLLRGARPEPLVSALVSQGVARALAEREVRAQASSPLLAPALKHANRLALYAELQRRLGRTAKQRIERVPDLDAETFYDRYYAANRPVVITGWVRRWPAFGRWSPADFAARLGDLEVKVSSGRESDPDYDMNEAKLVTSMPVADLVARMEGGGESNDLYMIARNRNLAHPRFAALLEEVETDPAILDRPRFAGGVQLWMGPAGTVTPMHHDTSNILFCQVYGHKRVVLVPAWEFSLLRTARQLYATFDPEHPDPDTHPDVPEDAPIVVDLAPGDAIFLPVGWWHHVRATSASISLAFVCFTRANDFEWYRPGAAKEVP